MSSNEITNCEDACNRTTFPLPPELRMKIYEQLLVRPDRSLKPNGLRPYEEEVEQSYRDKNRMSINVLLTCRTIYEEALPILYGKNILAFHDNHFSNQVLPFPEGHLVMVKHVDVQMCPSIYGSADKMGNLLMLLGTSGANIVNIHIRINISEACGKFYGKHFQPVLSLSDRFLVGDHPIVAGLFSLKAAKKMVIQMDNEARFEPGVADALKEAFMKEGTARDRSITIVRSYDAGSGELIGQISCAQYWHPKEESEKGPHWLDFIERDYEDDMLSRQAVENFVLSGGILERRKAWEAESTTGKAAEEKTSLDQTAVTKYDTMTG